MDEACGQDNDSAGRKSCKYGTEVARAVIEIGSEATSLLVASTQEGRITPLLERRQRLTATRLGARALAAVVESEAAIAGEAGAESVTVMVEPELRGSHLARGLDRRLRAAGFGPLRVPTAAERGSLTFRGATAGLAGASAATESGSADLAAVAGAEVTVVEVGNAATTIAVGPPAGRPLWWSARPLSCARLMRTALRGDPPAPEHHLVALELARSRLSNLKPPAGRQVLLIGPDASLVALACGEAIDVAACERARSRYGLNLSEITAAQLGVEPPLGRRLPAALAIVQAVCELLDAPARIVHAGPAEGLLLNESEEVGAGGSAHA